MTCRKLPNLQVSSLIRVKYLIVVRNTVAQKERINFKLNAVNIENLKTKGR